MTQDVFYAGGLRFECTRCSKCCRHTPGYVFLSEVDIERLVGALSVSRQTFLREYCHRVQYGFVHRISLKEKSNLDCTLWNDGGCSVYQARPLQCRSFPFWASCLASPEEWRFHGRQCPGIDTGRLHTRQEIDGWLALRLQEPLIDA